MFQIGYAPYNSAMIWNSTKTENKAANKADLSRTLTDPAYTEKKIVEAGWGLLGSKNFTSLNWDIPRPFSRNLPKPTSAKSVQVCPAAVDFDARYYVLCAPETIDLRLAFAACGRATLEQSFQDPAAEALLKDVFTFKLANSTSWRHLNRPIVEFESPYVFLSDEDVFINLTSAFMHYTQPALPGLVLNSRFPLNLWPRKLAWAFEWYDTSRPLVIKKGEPWFYVSFESIDPSRRVRLVNAEITPGIGEFVHKISAVSQFAKQTQALIMGQQKDRPSKLLIAPKS